MSGHFQHNEYRIQEISESIDRLIKTNSNKDQFGYCQNYSPEILEKFRETKKLADKLYKMIRVIDYLVCNDIGEESFFEEWSEEVESHICGLNKDMNGKCFICGKEKC